jgi:hypothetical protein
MMTSKNCGVMIQFLFTRSINWSEIARFAASKLAKYLRSVEEGKTMYFVSGFNKIYIPMISSGKIPKVNELASFTYQVGKEIDVFYHKKARAQPITLAIRGMIVGTMNDIKATIQNIMDTFASVRFVGDSLRYFDYGVDHNIGLSWLENNTIGTNYAYEIFKNNGNMWSDMRWGRGRDLVPFLCLTYDEFPVFVSLPTDPNLPVSYRRKKVRGMNYDKLVFPLGRII